MTTHYENGPEGMPRVERMTDSTIMAVLSQKNVPTIYVHSEQDYASLRLFAHAIAEETLARVPAWPVARTTYPVSEQNETVAVLPNGRTAANVYEAYRIGMEQTAVELAAPDTSQDWAKLDGATAFHLIERHAEDWAETGGMMESWLAARMAAAAPAAPVAEPQTVAEQGELRNAAQLLLDVYDDMRAGRKSTPVFEALRTALAKAGGAAQEPNADCSGDPKSCPDNEGYGCACDPMNTGSKKP